MVISSGGTALKFKSESADPHAFVTLLSCQPLSNDMPSSFPKDESRYCLADSRRSFFQAQGCIIQTQTRHTKTQAIIDNLARAG